MPRLAEILEQGNVVGWFSGRMEFGRVLWGVVRLLAIHAVPKCNRS